MTGRKNMTTEKRPPDKSPTGDYYPPKQRLCQQNEEKLLFYKVFHFIRQAGNNVGGGQFPHVLESRAGP